MASTTQYHGGILLSRGLEYTALVKPDGCPHWCFPIGFGHENGKQSAASVVHNQTGMTVIQNMDDEYVEVGQKKEKGCLEFAESCLL